MAGLCPDRQAMDPETAPDPARLSVEADRGGDYCLSVGTQPGRNPTRSPEYGPNLQRPHGVTPLYRGLAAAGNKGANYAYRT